HADLLHALGKMAKYHLERTDGQHVTLVPGFQDTAAYRQLAEHFSVFSKLEAILKPRVVSVGDGSLRIGLELTDPKDGRSRELFSMPVPEDGVAENLHAYEHDLVDQLQRLGLVRKEQKPLLNADIE